MMLIDNIFNIGDYCYLKTDPDQNGKIITGINIRETGIMYEISFCQSSSWHYGFELSKEKDVLKQ